MIFLHLILGLVEGMENIRSKQDGSSSKLVKLLLKSAPLAYIQAFYQHPKIKEAMLPLALAVENKRALRTFTKTSIEVEKGVIGLTKSKKTRDFTNFMKKKTKGFLPIMIAFFIAGFREQDFNIDGVEEEEEEEEGEEGPGGSKWWSHQRTLDLQFLTTGKDRKSRRPHYTAFTKACNKAGVGGSEKYDTFSEAKHAKRYGLWWTILAPLLISDIKSSVGSAVLQRLRQQGEGGGGDNDANNDDDDDDDDAWDAGSIGHVQGLLDLDITSDEQAR
jgi:hypothetical protein